MNAASRCGTKYFAVVSMPRCNTPVCTLRSLAMRFSASLKAPSTRSTYTRKYSPVSVRVTFPPLRSNSGKRTADSSCLICMETAGAVRCSSSAARAKLARRATAANTCSCRIVTGSIRNPLTPRSKIVTSRYRSLPPVCDQAGTEASPNEHSDGRDRQAPGARPLRCRRPEVPGDGLLATGLLTARYGRDRALTHHAAGRGRARRGGCGRRWRIVDCDLDRRVDGPPDRLRRLPRKGVSRRSGPQHRPGLAHGSTVFRLHRIRARPVRGRLDRESHGVDHRQRV